jgi:hypothetical protein
MNWRILFALAAAALLALSGCGDGESRGSSAGADPADSVALVGETDADITIAVSFGDLGLRPIQTKGGEFLEAAIDDFDYWGEIGAPALPAVRRAIALPIGAEATVEAEPGMVDRVRVDGLIAPNQPPVEKLPGAFERAPFAFDQDVYATDAFVVGRWAEIVEEGLVRNHRVALLEITPVDYNPVKGEMLIARDLRITIHLDGADFAQAAAMAERWGSPIFDQLIRDNTLNKGGKWALFSAPPAGAGYLIIYADALAGTALNSLVTLKTNDGWTVTTKKISEIGATATALASYIKSRYNASPTLTFVLLVGDTDTIPYKSGTGANNPATDLYFSTMNIGDYFPDLLLGRLPARTTAQLQNMVTKISGYETATGTWRKAAAFMASNDNYTISEGTHNWVISTYLNGAGYASQKLYSHTYNATTAQVTAAFNAGLNYGIYSGHGDVTYWADGPVFYQSNVNALTNTKYPFVCSFACLTGQYTSAECFAETWLRATGGASTMIASSVTSYWNEDDWFERGMFTAMYNFPDASKPEQVWAASAMFSGKYSVWVKSNHGGSSRRYFEQYNLFGDPSIVLHTN